MDPTHLPEERARGITIDLGFAHLALPHPHEPARSFEIGVVDVPGHEDFIKNMVAGVGSVDLALLVVACDDGWMPQTEEHLQILDYLGVRRALVALTKADLAPDPAAVASAVRSRLQGSPFHDAPLIPVSAHSRAGMDLLRATLASVCASLPTPPDTGKPRLWVDRAMTLRGIGTVVTGTLTGGVLQRGATVARQPGGSPVRIRGLQIHGQDSECASPSQRVALSLPDLAVAQARDAARTAADIRRGDLITLPSDTAASTTWEVDLYCSWRLATVECPATPLPRLKPGVRVRIHHGTHQAIARLVLSPGARLEPGGSVLAQLRFNTPQPAFVGDRFVVREWTARLTLAGGTVLNLPSSPRLWRDPDRNHALHRRRTRLHDPVELVATELLLHGPVRRSHLLAPCHHSAAALQKAADHLVASGASVERGGWLMDASAWASWLSCAETFLDDQHRAHPQRCGTELSELRSRLGAAGVRPECFEALRSELLARGFTQTSASIRRRTHRPVLPPSLRPAEVRIRAKLSAHPLEPPPRSSLAGPPDDVQVLRFLIDSGQAVEAGPDVVFLAEAWTQAVLLIKGHLRRNGAATAGQLREVLGTSRRVIVPVLEKLDHDGVTLREGDLRRLKPKP
jgi:selenocysteine-specific elongation factor